MLFTMNSGYDLLSYKKHIFRIWCLLEQ